MLGLAVAAIACLALSGFVSFQAAYASASGANIGAPPQPDRGSNGPSDRYMLVAKSDADYDALRAEVVKAGGKVVREMRDIKTLAVSSAPGAKDQVKTSAHVAGVARDGVRRLIRPDQQQEFFGTTQLRQRISADFASRAGQNRPDLKGIDRGSSKPVVTPDPALALPGLTWDVARIQAPKAWSVTLGNPAVRVGVADTGLDFTHPELQGQVADVVDFTDNEDPLICKNYMTLPTPDFPSAHMSDADMAAYWGGPATTDWNGHGTWIGGSIAAALNGQGTNGIAPRVKLVSLKIAQWCGAAYDSSILDAILYAADHGIDVVSISFSGYLNLQDPADALTYSQYVAAVARASAKGTVVVASAGNVHVRVGQDGRVLSHGSLTGPGGTVEDLYGLYEVPGGVPGVVDVAATSNVVNASSADCAPDTTDFYATCKPKNDRHQPFGAGRQNQLSYYSNYGPRIDVAAPGGAPKFNLPWYDRGGTPGYPVTTADGFNAWEDFGITSNWGIVIPCYALSGGPFSGDACYSTIQGTSMAAPHVSAALSLIASRNPELRHKPRSLIALLKEGAQDIEGNATPPLSASDKSGGDLTGGSCPDGSCHLGGEAISDEEAYGAGLVDAYRPLASRR